MSQQSVSGVTNDVTLLRPKLAYRMAHGFNDRDRLTFIDRFYPRLPNDIWLLGVHEDRLQRADDEIQYIIDQSALYVQRIGESDHHLADRIGNVCNEFVSPAFRELLEDLEPGRHRFFEVTVKSHDPLAGRLDHGTHYWLRPPPQIDCILFPLTQTVDDLDGVAWSKRKSLGSWGGGITFKEPVYLDGVAVGGHHVWETRQSNANTRTRNGFIPTWSVEFLNEYRKRKLSGWQVMNEMHLIYER